MCVAWTPVDANFCAASPHDVLHPVPIHSRSCTSSHLSRPSACGRLLTGRLSSSALKPRMQALHLDGGSSSVPTAVNVHPVVLFSVLDQHLRRAEGQDRVIGAQQAADVDWMRLV